MIVTAADREIAILERQLAETDDPEERAEIQRAIRDVELDEAERQSWEDDGYDRGWR